MKQGNRILKSAVWIIGLSLAAEPVLAQVIEEVVVTARKRSESLQEIPESVTVLNADLIEAARINNIKDFSALVPNLNVSTNFRKGLSFVTIRGLITPQVGEAPILSLIHI